ncbi:MAG: histidine--tRNA ligase [Candidatus Yanofskybacteria bacterium RIFCSPHIGHO2_02_FULL_44_12b]|uniref:Histidine--tRNA ligase n=2 Tax=Candidatus Yanofskyibacteriota TaxID=1752733 RepID=A0A1F8GIM7_9BACT|nr:MAG: histidine--tRNA ligase [Candidatus Yanofskybacteria bacterium RIFCSPHIGHO2_01_FULL_44_24]OGN14070.1 MAG: histidine--tRNA ligase [Candidatus Yanofskybacteria bacterium RIFCSPHIGHO2_02_FULL_44_12b]OGN25173.1 MAG: histidine--tRNA ligase [Candidatus Yanofskybacteria bacterium RIFCSPLOWO2_01_FULL_44_22]
MAKQKTIQAPKGMHDILPEDQKYWRHVMKKSQSLIEDYSFERIDTPIVEPTELFLRSVGSSSDIAEKEIYNFKTKGGDDISLRPEGTASTVRAYLENGMNVRPHPVKLYYIGPMFRHDQPQQGRYRQFYQLGLETIGDASEVVDAELIFLGYKILDSVGLHGYNVHINSIGDQSCRPAYLRALKDFYKNKIKKVCPQCRIRFKKNVLRMLDCKEEGCREVNKEAPPIIDFLDDTCKTHFKRVLEFLDETKVPYILDSSLVRGLDYYTRTVFEFLPEENITAQSAVISGGRYDRLIDMLGGSKTPAAGWAMGIDRVVSEVKAKGISVPEIGIKPRVFLAQLGEAAKKKSLALFENLRKAGIEVKSSFGRDSIKSQLRIAHRLGVKYTLIFGQKEALEGTIILREMDTGIQETLLLTKVVDEMKKRLKK